MNYIINIVGRSGLLKRDFEYHLLRATMVVIFAWFGWDKWSYVVIEGLVPILTHGPFTMWMLPVMGIRGTSYFLGTTEWTIGLLIFLGFWNKKVGVLGALGSVVTFITTLTVLPFLPEAWESAAGGFPTMSTIGALLMKDIGLMAISIYLLQQDVARVIEAHATGEKRLLRAN